MNIKNQKKETLELLLCIFKVKMSEMLLSLSDKMLQSLAACKVTKVLFHSTKNSGLNFQTFFSGEWNSIVRKQGQP